MLHEKVHFLLDLSCTCSCNSQCIRVHKIIQHFKEPLKIHKKVTKTTHLTLYLKVHLSVQSRTPLRGYLKICLMVYFVIYIKIHKKCI